jgi:hypothetical protein
MSFFQRFVSMVINDVAVKSLANSRAFQRFALKTHYHVEDAKNLATTGVDTLHSTISKNAPKIKQFTSDFTTALKEELAKDAKKVK